MGKCAACGEWNTLQEEVMLREKASPAVSKAHAQLYQPAQPQVLSEIETGHTRRLETPDEEFNRVLGGGIGLGCFWVCGGVLGWVWWLGVRGLGWV